MGRNPSGVAKIARVNKKKKITAPKEIVVDAVAEDQASVADLTSRLTSSELQAAEVIFFILGRHIFLCIFLPF